MRRPIAAAAMGVLFVCCVPMSAAAMPAPTLAEILTHPRRNNDRIRDQYRHPADVLEFCDVRPGMTVADYMPAGGFYTRILVPWLGATGRYVGLTPDPSSSGLDKYKDFFAALPGPSRKELADWRLPGAPASILAMQEVPGTYDGTVDRILLIREMHVLLGARALQGELTRLRRMLKPGGALCVIQHRARPWADGDYTDGSKGYMRQSDVIGLIEAYGFQLLETSEVNANPRDPADHPEGVWGIPPVMAGAMSSQAIGDSDHMTLKFRKR